MGDADWDHDWRCWVSRVDRSPHPEERRAAQTDAGAELIVKYLVDVNDVVRAVTKRPLRAHPVEQREELVDRITACAFALARSNDRSLRTAIRRITFLTVMKWHDP